MIRNTLHCYIYKIYGLVIKSEIQITELIDFKEDDVSEFDCTISYGITPREITEPMVRGAWFQISKNEFYMYIEGVAHYYVSNGNSIIVEPEKGGNMEELKVFLLGSSLGLIMNQRNIIAIHGGTIAVDGGGIILTGSTGVGKSTLNSAFRQEGYYFLSDDVSALGKDDTERLIIHPTYPQAKLCKDAMIKMGYNVNDFTVIDEGRDKYAIPIHKNFLNYSTPLLGIYELSVGDVDNVEIIEVLGSEKVNIILKNTYRIELSRFVGFDRRYFKQCLEIASSIPVYRLIRPKDKFTVMDQINLIKDTLRLEKVI